MAEGIEFSVVALICYGLVDWTYKSASAAGVAAHQMLMTQAFFFVPIIFSYGLITDTLAFDVGYAWGIAAGAFIFVAMYFFNRSLASGAVSILAPIFRLSFVITAGLAMWLLDEPRNAGKLAGLASALGAVWLLLGPGRATAAARASSLGTAVLVQICVATAAMGVVGLIYKLGAAAGGSPATVLAGQASAFGPLATLFSCIRDRGLRVPRAAWPHAVATAVLLFVGTATLIRGLADGEASALVPVAQMGFIVTALIGFTVLRESVTRRGLMGLACALAALWLLARS